MTILQRVRDSGPAIGLRAALLRNEVARLLRRGMPVGYTYSSIYVPLFWLALTEEGRRAAVMALRDAGVENVEIVQDTAVALGTLNILTPGDLQRWIQNTFLNGPGAHDIEEDEDYYVRRLVPYAYFPWYAQESIAGLAIVHGLPLDQQVGYFLGNAMRDAHHGRTHGPEPGGNGGRPPAAPGVGPVPRHEGAPQQPANSAADPPCGRKQRPY